MIAIFDEECVEDVG
jgi:hypothetical protein